MQPQLRLFFWCVLGAIWMVALTCFILLLVDWGDSECRQDESFAPLHIFCLLAGLYLIVACPTFAYFIKTWHIINWPKLIILSILLTCVYMGALYGWITLGDATQCSIGGQIHHSSVQLSDLTAFYSSLLTILGALFLGPIGLLTVLFIMPTACFRKWCTKTHRIDLKIDSTLLPLEVNFLEGGDLPLIGMCMSPGRQRGRWNRSLYADLEVLKTKYRADGLITLITEDEMETMNVTQLPEQARRYGLESLHFPIRDKWIPDSIEVFAELVSIIAKAVQRGRRIVLHCNGGKGRTGVVACCTLISLGYSASQSIVHVRNARHGTIRNPLQIAYVYQFEREWPSLAYRF